MAKRTNDLNLSNNKKVKVDDLWEDDLDSDVIDDCFQLATQICEEDVITCTQRNNVTIIPTYSAFKEPKASSTQIGINNSILNASINNNGKTSSNYELKIRELQEKFEQKAGEAAILRSNLSEIKSTMKSEQERKQIEWNEKINCTQKQADGIKSALEFKNLEIANLKQRIKEMSKINAKLAVNSPQQISSPTTSKVADETLHPDFKNELNYKLATISLPDYPLKKINFSTIYLMNNNFQLCKSGQKNSISLDYIHPEISFLINLSYKQLNQESTYDKINKIVYAFTYFLTEFHDVLKKASSKSNIQSNHCSSDVTTSLAESGTKPSKILRFLSELILSCEYLGNYLFLNKNLVVEIQKEYTDIIPSDVNLKEEFFHLRLLERIVSTIGVAADVNCSEFLSSLVQFISNSFMCKISDETVTKLCDIINEILLVKPNSKVLLNVVEMFKIGSSKNEFIDCICTNSVPKNLKEVRLSKEFCIFYKFGYLLEQTASSMSLAELNVTITLNYLNLVFQIFQANPKWLLCSRNNCCECLLRLYKLSIIFIYKNIEKYKDKMRNPNNDTEIDYSALFKYFIKLMHLLTFYSNEIIERNITMFAQYKEIILTLTYFQHELNFEDSDVADLENLHINDDLPDVPINDFKGVDI